jgi:hypothetical protein
MRIRRIFVGRYCHWPRRKTYRRDKPLWSGLSKNHFYVDHLPLRKK